MSRFLAMQAYSKPRLNLRSNSNDSGTRAIRFGCAQNKG